MPMTAVCENRASVLCLPTPSITLGLKGRSVNAFVGFRLKRVRSFFALGLGVERWNCYETGMTWHAKVYLGPWVLLIDPRKSNAS